MIVIALRCGEKINILPVFLKSYHMEKKGQGGKSLANFVYLYFWNNV